MKALAGASIKEVNKISVAYCILLTHLRGFFLYPFFALKNSFQKVKNIWYIQYVVFELMLICFVSFELLSSSFYSFPDWIGWVMTANNLHIVGRWANSNKELKSHMFN